MHPHTFHDLARIRQADLLREAQLNRLAALGRRPARRSVAAPTRRLAAAAAAAVVCVVGSALIVLGVDLDLAFAAIRIR